MPPPADDRVVSVPFEEHTPMTVTEAGLVLDRARTIPWRLVVGGVVLLLGVVASVAVTRGGSSPGVVDLDVGACFAPAVTDVAEPVDEAPCGPGTVKVVRKVPGPEGADLPHPGDGALTLLGQGACQGDVDADRLVVAVPSPVAWADGDRTVVCTERQ